MAGRQQLLLNNVEKYMDMILEAERWIWAHPETGYTEWKAHQYLVEKFEAMGYKLILAGNIPGFYTDLDTGKPDPMLCIMGELDALNIANHPESVDGNAHCCGHHGQCAALLGVAAALKEPDALNEMCGFIRLMLVPAEETIQLEYREKLRREGIIKYYNGKKEFLVRGFFEGVDLAMMVHGGEGYPVAQIYPRVLMVWRMCVQAYREQAVCVNRNTNNFQNGPLTTDNWDEISRFRVRRAPYYTFDPIERLDSLCAEHETEVYYRLFQNSGIAIYNISTFLRFEPF